MSDAKIRRITKLMNELNADGDVKNTGLESAYTSNSYASSTFAGNTYASSTFAGNTYASSTFVSNNFFQNSSTYREGEIIENHYVPADGRQITTISGTANTEQVTGTQSFSNVQQKITGSEITGYKVPSGTKYVNYGHKIVNFGRAAAGSVDMQIYLYYKVNGGSYNLAAYHGNLYENNTPIEFDFLFEVGASTANVQLGTITESTPTLDFKLEARGRQSSQGANLHTTQGSEPWGTSPTPGSFAQPYVYVKSIAGS